jgi:hypothetical protein
LKERNPFEVCPSIAAPDALRQGGFRIAVDRTAIRQSSSIVFEYCKKDVATSRVAGNDLSALGFKVTECAATQDAVHIVIKK